MLTDKTSLTTQSTITGQGIEMTLDENSLAHIMGVLTKLYSDPELAVLREYSTNALDAHIAAGNPAPIQVTLPSPLNRTLSIKDQGIGLSVEDIHSIYSRYGASTKRNTNDQVGMLGLGCKSALTYSNQFTLVTVKDGVKATVLIQRNDAGGGTMTIVDTVSTTERNGVEVIVPVKADDNFERKARNFFRFWEPGTVLVNGQQPEGVNVRLKVTEDIAVIDSETNNHYIVMGNVAYPLRRYDDARLPDVPYSMGLMVRVPVGAVNFVPSREALEFTPKTVAAIEAAGEEYTSNLATALSRELDKVPTRHEAVKFIYGLKDLSRSSIGKLTYRNQLVPTKVGVSVPTEYITLSSLSGKLSHHSSHKEIDMSYAADTLFVHGFEQGFTAAVKKKLMKFVEDSGMTGIKHFALTKTPVDGTWLNRANVTPWAPIKAIKLPRPEAGYSRGGVASLGDTYECRVGGDTVYLTADEINDLIVPVFYFIESKDSSFGVGNFRPVLAEKYEEEFVLVGFYGNRESKFCRLVPSAKTAYGECKAIAEAWAKSLSADVRLAHAVQNDYGSRSLKALHGTNIADPKVRLAIEAASVDLTSFQESAKLYRVFIKLAAEKWENPLGEYPLLKSYYASQREKDHAVIYINAVYAANNPTK